MADPLDPKRDMQRKRLILGIFALVMAVVALWLNVIDEDLGKRYAAFQSGSVRMAAVLAVLWLALPDTTKGPAVWLVLGGLITAIMLVPKAGKMGFKLILPAIAILGALAYLRRFTALLSGKPRSPR